MFNKLYLFDRIRSKYICRPRAVVEVGNHFVWEFRAGNVAAHVPDTLAVMHHYRTCEFGGDTCLANPSIQDRSAWKYGDALATAVRQRFRQFGLSCPVLLPTAAVEQHSATIATTITTMNISSSLSSTSNAVSPSPFLISWRIPLSHITNDQIWCESTSSTRKRFELDSFGFYWL